MKKQYILIQNTPELKKGAILEEECEGGDQDFVCVNISKFRKFKSQEKACYHREVIMKQPKYFQKVVFVQMSVEEKKQFDKLIRKK